MMKRRELIVGMAALTAGIVITEESEAAFPLVINLARILLTGLRTTGTVSRASSAFSTGLRASRVLPAANQAVRRDPLVRRRLSAKEKAKVIRDSYDILDNSIEMSSGDKIIVSDNVEMFVVNNINDTKDFDQIKYFNEKFESPEGIVFLDARKSLSVYPEVETLHQKLMKNTSLEFASLNYDVEFERKHLPPGRAFIRVG